MDSGFQTILFHQFDRLMYKPIVSQVLKYLYENIEGCSDPSQFGKSLSGDLSGLHRYRVADYRIICRLEHGRMIVLAFGICHRKNVYQRIRLTYRKLTNLE